MYQVCQVFSDYSFYVYGENIDGVADLAIKQEFTTYNHLGEFETSDQAREKCFEEVRDDWRNNGSRPPLKHQMEGITVLTVREALNQLF